MLWGTANSSPGEYRICMWLRSKMDVSFNHTYLVILCKKFVANKGGSGVQWVLHVCPLEGDIKYSHMAIASVQIWGMQTRAGRDPILLA